MTKMSDNFSDKYFKSYVDTSDCREEHLIREVNDCSLSTLSITRQDHIMTQTTIRFISSLHVQCIIANLMNFYGKSFTKSLSPRHNKDRFKSQNWCGNWLYIIYTVYDKESNGWLKPLSPKISVHNRRNRTFDY